MIDPEMLMPVISKSSSVPVRVKKPFKPAQGSRCQGEIARGEVPLPTKVAS